MFERFMFAAWVKPHSRRYLSGAGTLGNEVLQWDSDIKQQHLDLHAAIFCSLSANKRISIILFLP